MRLSMRAYAKHRGLTEGAIRKAVKRGQITKEDDGKLDPVIADRQWEQYAMKHRQRTKDLHPIPSQLAGDIVISEIVFLSPQQGNFSGDPTHWYFQRYSDNSMVKVDRICDPRFLNQCRAGHIRLFEKDVLKVCLVTTYNQRLKEVRQTNITDVLAYTSFEDKQLDFLELS